MSQEPKVTRFGADPTVAQELATKAYVDAGGGGGAGQTFAKVVKSVDQTINNSTTLQDDDELFAALLINKIYSWLQIIFINSGTIPDFKYAFSIPSGASGIRITNGETWRSAAQTTINITTAQAPATTGADTVLFLWGRVIMGGTPGNLQFQWAQNTLNASDTKVLQAATLLVWED